MPKRPVHQTWPELDDDGLLELRSRSATCDSKGRWPSEPSSFADLSFAPAASTSICTSTCPTSGSHPTAPRRSPSRLPGALAAREARRYPDARGRGRRIRVVHAHSFATRLVTPSQRVSTSATSETREVRLTCGTVSRVLTHRSLYSKSFVLHLDSVVRAEPPG